MTVTMPEVAAFHVVKCSFNDVFQTYKIYANNEPYLIPAKGQTLGKREAYNICRLLNDGPWA